MKLDHLAILGSDDALPTEPAFATTFTVSDLANAYVLALEFPDKGGPSTALNLGTGMGHSNLQLARDGGEAHGQEVPVKNGSR